MQTMQDAAKQQIDLAGFSDKSLPHDVEQMNNYTSVILSNLGIAFLRLPSNSPVREHLSRALHATEELADIALALHKRVTTANRETEQILPKRVEPWQSTPHFSL